MFRVFGVSMKERRRAHIDQTFAGAWAGADPFAAALNQRGEIYREKEGRRTLRFAAGGRHYFLKLHQGVGWREVIKNLAQLRLPVISARNEWRAIAKLRALGLDTLSAVAYGRRGRNPARQLSFIVTEELADTVGLDGLCEAWRERPPAPALKRAVIARVAAIARTMHRGGVNHRDFYLCHLRVDLSMRRENLTAANLRVFVIDLHRAQIRRRAPARWVIKDLGGLYFSARAAGLTSRDILRFMRAYHGGGDGEGSLRATLAERKFWTKVARKAERIERGDRGR